MEQGRFIFGITTGHSWISYFIDSGRRAISSVIPFRYVQDGAVSRGKICHQKCTALNAWTPTRAISLTSPGHPSCHANRGTRFHSCRIRNSGHRVRPTEISEGAFWPLESGPCIIERHANKIRTVSPKSKRAIAVLSVSPRSLWILHL